MTGEWVEFGGDAEVLRGSKVVSIKVRLVTSKDAPHGVIMAQIGSLYQYEVVCEALEGHSFGPPGTRWTVSWCGGWLSA